MEYIRSLLLFAAIPFVFSSTLHGDTFTATYRLNAVEPGSGNLVVRLPITNNFDFPVETAYVKASCRCTSPKANKRVVLKPGESSHAEFEITVASKPEDLGVTVTVYGWREGQERPKKPKLADYLELSRFAISVPVRPLIQFDLPKDLLKVETIDDPTLRLVNRTGEEWSAAEVQVVSELGIEAVALDTKKDSFDGEQYFPFKLVGLRPYFKDLEGRPSELDLVVFKGVEALVGQPPAFQQVSTHKIAVEFSSGYEVRPKFVRRSDRRSYITIACGERDAREIAAQLELQLGSGEEYDAKLWKASALSDRWLRVEVDLVDVPEGEEFLEVSLPKRFWQSRLLVR